METKLLSSLAGDRRVCQFAGAAAGHRTVQVALKQQQSVLSQFWRLKSAQGSAGQLLEGRQGDCL